MRAKLAKGRELRVVKALVWTSAARADLDHILEHFADDPRVGVLLVGRVDRAAKGLARMDSGRPGRVSGTREKSVARTRYLLIYEVDENQIVVFRVVHTAQIGPRGENLKRRSLLLIALANRSLAPSQFSSSFTTVFKWRSRSFL